MEKWYGSAAVSVEDGKILMVRQGKPDEIKKWAVPAGGKEPGESDEACCVREVYEETGYQVEVIRPLYEKTGRTFGVEVRVKYFEVNIVGGEAVLHDPDQLICEIAWKTSEELKTLDLGFPEDRDFLINFINKK